MQGQQRDYEKQFTVKSCIGSGTFGQVFKCINNKTGQLCAIKLISKVDPISIDKIQEEVQIMKRIQSDYSLELLDHFYDNMTSSYILVTPYCRKGSLEKRMKDDWNLDSLLLFLIQITQGFLQFSSKQVMHLDLKPQNILINNTEQFLICDFGCSKVHQSFQQSMHFLKMSLSKGLGTAQYTSPEVRKDTKANKYSDVWSLGVILYKMIYHKTPFIKTQGFGAYKTKYEGHKQQLQPILGILQHMLAIENRIKWIEIKTKIYTILKIPSHIKIVTSIYNYIQYVKNLIILITCFMHLLQRLEAHKILQKCHINPEQLIKMLLLYLYDLTKDIINNQEYFIFEQTKNRIKVDQKVQFSAINKQIKKILQEKNIINQRQFGLIRRKQLIFNEAKRISNKFMKLPQNLIEYFHNKSQLEYFKLQKILKFINPNEEIQDPFDYKYRKKLKNLVQFLVYS